MVKKDDAFPFRQHTKIELLEEYEKMRSKLNDVTEIIFPIPYSRIGYKCSNNFFQYERMKTPSWNNIDCFTFWSKKKDKIIAFHESRKHLNSRDLMATTIFMKHAPAQFPPYIAGLIYKYFNAKKVLDPFAGWGDRCLAAMAMGISYTGIDCNTNLIPLYEAMIDFFPHKGKVRMMFDKCENVDLSKIDFDFIFTSPPFFHEFKNKMELVEHYHNSEKDYSDFISECLLKLIMNIIKTKPEVWICLNITEMMYDDLEPIIGKCNKIITFKSASNLSGKNHSKTSLNNVYCYNYNL